MTKKELIYENNIAYGEPGNIRKTLKMCNVDLEFYEPYKDVFIDVGTNAGQEIDFFMQYNIFIDSYEAHPKTYEYLCNKYRGDITFDSITKSKVLKNNYADFSITNAPVWKCSENKIFYFKEPPNTKYFGHGDGGSTLMGTEKITVSSRYGLNMKTIDIVDVINKWKEHNIKILKLDVEGAEYHILKRLIDEDLIFKPEYIFFEDHGEKIDSEEFFRLRDFVLDFKEKNNLKFYKW